LDDRVPIPGSGRDFSLCHHFQTVFGVHSASSLVKDDRSVKINDHLSASDTSVYIFVCSFTATPSIHIHYMALKTVLPVNVLFLHEACPSACFISETTQRILIKFDMDVSYTLKVVGIVSV
jgi:hypothetical protein